LIYACPQGSMQQMLNSWNFSICRSEYSTILEIVTDPHQSANCMLLSGFITCMTT
jgi:hypothetical protein